MVPTYEDLELNKYYRIVLNSFLTKGGDGFTMISQNLINLQVGEIDIKVVKRHIERETPIITDLDERITIVS